MFFLSKVYTLLQAVIISKCLSPREAATGYRDILIKVTFGYDNATITIRFERLICLEANVFEERIIPLLLT